MKIPLLLFCQQRTSEPLNLGSSDNISPSLRLNIRGKGPFNNLSGHTVWIDDYDTGKDHFYGFTTFGDKDGDKIFCEDQEGSAPNTGKAKLLWGSGKFAGIEGTTDLAYQDLKSWPDGTRRTITRAVWKVTLKKPLQ